MRYLVRVTPSAERDLAEILEFLMEREGPVQAEDILDRILAAARDLERLPERGSQPRELQKLGILEFRQVLAPPYRLIYRISGRQVFLLLVADGRRDFQGLLERRLLRG